MSAANAKTSLGAKLFMGTAAGSLTEVTEVLSITPPRISREVIDASDLATTGGKEKIAAGLYDAGNFSASLHYVAGSAGDDALVGAVTDGAIRYFKVTVKAASGTEDITFAGYVTEYGPDELTIDGKQTAGFTVAISGDIAQAASA